MASLASTGVELLRELKRSDDHAVPLYNDDALRVVAEEVTHLNDDVKDTIDEFKEKDGGERLKDPRVLSSIGLQYAAIQRNIRCALAYLNERLVRLKAMRWGLGAVLPDDVQQNTSEQERTAVRQYNSLLSSYMSEMDIDLTRNLTPPKELDVQVRVLDDAGELDTETGEVISLTRGSEHLLRRADAEQLIRQGVLKHVE